MDFDASRIDNDIKNLQDMALAISRQGRLDVIKKDSRSNSRNNSRSNSMISLPLINNNK